MSPRRSSRLLVLLAFASALLAAPRSASAHAALKAAVPARGAELDRAPAEIKLTFTEAIEPGLSSISVRERSGSWFVTVRGNAVPRDPRSFVAAVQPPQPGTYDVEWRAVSADGHAATGSYSFTIRAAGPTQYAPPRSAATASTPGQAAPAPPPIRASRREMAARWLFMTGVAALLGAAVASVGRFEGTADFALAGGGWIAAFLGIALLADAQRRTAGTDFGELLRSSIGRALVLRAVALMGAGAALVAARGFRRGAVRHRAMFLVMMLVLAVMGIHVAAGHAAAVERFTLAAIALQWLHFAAAGVWLGGRSALLIGTRGEPDSEKAAAVHQYSTLAGYAIAIVGVSGVLRAVQELSSWDQLAATAYGQAVLAKGALLVAIGALGALNRWHSVPLAPTTLRPLRFSAAGELVLMLVTLAVAAILATLPPPR